jgi:hypothetical protein
MYLATNLKRMREMKSFMKNIWLFTIITIMVGALATSCEDDDEVNGGKPVIHYVRVTNPNSSDSLLGGAYLGNLVAIMGDNLGGLRELYFNDRKAALNPTYITNTTVLVNVPSAAPVEATDKMTLTFRNGSQLVYDFVVRIPPPEVYSMDLEYVAEGDVAGINGRYFFDVTPVKVEFTAEDGGFVQGTVTATAENRLEVVVPAGASSGPIRVTTNFGSVLSSLHFRDERNIIINFDDAGKTPTGAWRNGLFGSEDGIDGRYLILRGVLDMNERNEDYNGGGYVMQFWGETSGRAPGPFFAGPIEEYVLKFEARVEQWYGSHLNITYAPSNHSGSNQEYWSNSINARGLWAPWEVEDKMFTTDSKWITVTIPMTEMQYYMDKPNDVVYTGGKKFDKSKTGSMSFWVIGSPKSDKSPVEVFIDNVRIVEK